MKVFFTTPFEGKKLYQKDIDLIISILEKNGAQVISLEKSEQKRSAYSKQRVRKEGSLEKAHYHFIRQGIANADAVIIEATYEDFRVGHEATLAILYQKPLLVLSLAKDYGKLIPHENFLGKRYNEHNIEEIIQEFFQRVRVRARAQEDRPSQPLQEGFDIKHAINLAQLRMRAQMGSDYVANWAKRAQKEPMRIHNEILKKLGNLPVHEPWDIFSKIYSDDTPDHLIEGPVEFADQQFRKLGIRKDDLVVDAACGTGAVARQLTQRGYKQIIAFDKSRPMLGEAYRLCAYMPNVKILEASFNNLKLSEKADAIVWIGYSSNYAMDEKTLIAWLKNIITNLDKKGCLIFDVRTKNGWDVDMYKQPVTIFESKKFQRIWINDPDYQHNTIKFDIFIRLKNENDEWMPWEREQMIERMWTAQEVASLLRKMKDINLLGTYDDDLEPVSGSDDEPGLAYFVIQKK